MPHAVPRPFLVIATQNPIELDGTYRLPEAQLDRFLMRVAVGYPDHDAEVRVVLGAAAGVDPDDAHARPRPSRARCGDHAGAGGCTSTRWSPTTRCELAAATREHPAVRYGASPRGSVALVSAARAAAAIEDRSFVTPDDIKDVAHAVLAHRIVLTPEAELNRRTAAEVLDDVLGATAQPTAVRA